MRIGQRAVVGVLTWAMCRWGDHAEIRRVFDEKYADESEEWRRETWRAAAERAALKASR